MRFKLTPEKRRELRDTGDASIAGWMLVVCIVIGALGGEWADKHFHVAPNGVLVGVLLGVGAGFVNLFTVVQRIKRAEEEEDRQKRNR
ncbi:MAG TPA: AtpZ/AtpI family protein [Armatimonadota bacterium]|jgi:F0F1-type ATP synthase assembly protein I